MASYHYLALPLLALSLAACTATTEDVAGSAAAIGVEQKGECAELHDGKPHFSYDDEGHGGPDDWDELVLASGEPAYPACGGSGQQSPIALPAPRLSGAVSRGAFELGPPSFGWAPRIQVKSVINNGHTWLANVDPITGSGLTDESTEYVLSQFHFHAPSEHTIDGEHMPLEAHFVHLGPEGRQPFAEVIAVMFEEGPSDNPELAKIWDHFDRCPQAKATPLVSGVALEVRELLPADRTYLRYDGSLTAPPCTRTVRFRVLTKPVKASARQIAKLVAALGPTNRPTQPVASGTSVSLHQH